MTMIIINPNAGSDPEPEAGVHLARVEGMAGNASVNPALSRGPAWLDSGGSAIGDLLW